MGRAQLKKFTAKVDVSTARSSGRQPGFPSKEQLRGASVDLKDSAADGRVHLHLLHQPRAVWRPMDGRAGIVSAHALRTKTERFVRFAESHGCVL